MNLQLGGFRAEGHGQDAGAFVGVLKFDQQAGGLAVFGRGEADDFGQVGDDHQGSHGLPAVDAVLLGDLQQDPVGAAGAVLGVGGSCHWIGRSFIWWLRASGLLFDGGR